MTTEVILVHGLWYGPWAMAVLARRLRRAGHVVRRFAYHPTASPVAVHARDLAQFTRQSHSTALHFVGHSMGGLVIMRMLANEPALARGRVVLLGTPLQGSQVARRLLRLPAGAVLLGALATDLCQAQPRWAEGREIGMIAGCKAFGLGRLLGRPGAGSDGTVALSEADAPGLSARVVLPVSHTGMLFSGQVGQQVLGFLQNGRFSAVGVARGERLS
jgi:pimeloyl-ACP methyl ester carboxylesterase